MGMPDRVQLSRVNREILEKIHSERLTYPTLVAKHQDIELEQVENRCRQLAERDFLEKVSEETVYRTTEEGTRVLD